LTKPGFPTHGGAQTVKSESAPVERFNPCAAPLPTLMSIKKRAAIIFGRTQLIKNPPVSDVYAIRPPVGSPLPTRVH